MACEDPGGNDPGIERNEMKIPYVIFMHSCPVMVMAITK